MRILIEEYQYEAAAVKELLHGLDALENIEGKVSIHYVGYYYNTLLQDCVFILPKVLLKDENGKELVFGKYAPEDIIEINPNRKDLDNDKKKEFEFLYKLAVWIYRAITVYKNNKNNDTSIVYYSKIAQLGNGKRHLSNTYLEILLSLIQFNRDNRNFFITTIKNIHRGFNKINWTRTISHSTAIIQDDSPIYLNPVNKKRLINFDEELLVIFFSILNYIGDEYGFEKHINYGFDLITGSKFKHYINGYGARRLKQIKYKYFSDKALELWNLCYAFFDQSKQITVATDQKEYLVVKSFYIVFEAIIDELIGDNPLPDGMTKEQEDGKIIDHLFTAKSLIENDRNENTYYIGDSKYYKMGNSLGSVSIYKQFTYARNVIQWNLDIFNSGKETESGIKLRDDETEGYDIIPNFFISARMNEDLKYSDDRIDRIDDSKGNTSTFHFENRLFDRDTLLLFHYDVNFLFVLSLYARNSASKKAEWKNKIREKFRKDIQTGLQEKFNFYAMKAHPDTNDKEFLQNHFKQVLGKVFKPFKDDSIYSLALDKENKYKEENNELLKILRTAYYVEECKLGQDPAEVLPEITNTITITEGVNDMALCVTKEGPNYDIALDKLHETSLVGIALKMDGAALKLVEGFTSAKYLVVHNKGARYSVFFISESPRLISGSEGIDMMVTKKDEPLYLVYKIDTSIDVKTGSLDFSAITKGGDGYSPHLVPLSVITKP